jgi:hypothetical protein
VFENRVLRRIFGPKREEVLKGWRGLHNEELPNLYTSPGIRVIKIKEAYIGRTCSLHVRDENCIQYFGLKT